MHALQPGILYHIYLSRNDSHTGCDIGVWVQFTVFWDTGDSQKSCLLKHRYTPTKYSYNKTNEMH